jgi:hypothetical protein
MLEASTAGAHPRLAASLEYPVLAAALVKQYMFHHFMVLLA